MKAIMNKIEDFINSTENVSFNSIAKFIKVNYDKMDNYTIFMVSKMTNTSPSSVTRFCKKIGLSGYKSLAVVLKIENSYKTLSQKAVSYSARVNGKIVNDYYGQTREVVYKSLVDVSEKNKDKIEMASELIKEANSIYIFGKGGNRNMIKMFTNWMVKLGKHIIFSGDVDQQLVYAKNVQDNDLIIIVSYSLSSNFIEKLYNRIEHDIKKIVITKNLYSKLAIESNLVLEMGNNENIIDGTYSSEISTLFIFKALFHSLLDDKTIKMLKFSSLQ